MPPYMGSSHRLYITFVVAAVVVAMSRKQCMHFHVLLLKVRASRERIEELESDSEDDDEDDLQDMEIFQMVIII